MNVNDEFFTISKYYYETMWPIPPFAFKNSAIKAPIPSTSPSPVFDRTKVLTKYKIKWERYYLYKTRLKRR